MKTFFKRMWQQLWCKHDYKEVNRHLIEAGMSKMVIYHCQKCPKSKVKIV